MQDRTASELLNIREAAEFLRVSETSLRRWTNAGRLPCVRIGGRRERRFRRSDLLAFVGGGGEPRLRGPLPNHFCGLYTSDLSRARAAATFLAAGLRGDALCFLVARRDVQRAVIEVLGRDVTLDRLVMAEFRDSASAQIEFFRAGLGDAVRDGASRMQLVGDVSGGALGRLPFAEILELEAEFTRSIARQFPVMSLCLYDARRISGVEVAGLAQQHDGGLH
ncbi:MAG TPA: MEDS domain-containing protein [Gemmatimonadales bacterium]|jgi:transcriptional repressor of dcmA and dcmR|nr:MEDS domain-containing protein [Gemmatimonadales bacterium]